MEIGTSDSSLNLTDFCFTYNNETGYQSFIGLGLKLQKASKNIKWLKMTCDSNSSLYSNYIRFNLSNSDLPISLTPINHSENFHLGYF